MELKRLQDMCKRMMVIRAEIAHLDEEKKELNAELSKLKAEAVEHLDEHEIKSFDHGMGKISVVERQSVKIVDKYKLFDWLRKKGTFEDVISVNAQTANRIYRDELEMAKENGDIEFIANGIDGLSEPNIFRDIRFLK